MRRQVNYVVDTLLLLIVKGFTQWMVAFSILREDASRIDYCQTPRVCHWFIFRELKCLILDRWVSCWIDEWVDDRNEVTKNPLQVNGCTFRKEQLDGYSCCSYSTSIGSHHLTCEQSTPQATRVVEWNEALFSSKITIDEVKWNELNEEEPLGQAKFWSFKQEGHAKAMKVIASGMVFNDLLCLHILGKTPSIVNWIILSFLRAGRPVSWCCWIVNELGCTRKRIGWYQDTLSLKWTVMTVLYSTVWKLSPQTSRGWKPTT